MRRVLRWRIAIAVLLCVVCGSTTAFAQANQAAAEALFRSGREAMQARDFDAALAKLRESYRLDPALGTLLNVAVCEEELGALTDAWRHYQEVVHAVAASDSRAVVAAKRLEALELRLPRLVVTPVGTPPADLHVRIGETIDLGAASFGLPLPINPGEHAIVVSAAGRQDVRFNVTLREGERLQLPVLPGPETNMSAPSAPSNAVRDTSTNAPTPHATAAAAIAHEPHQPSPVPYVLLGAASVALLTSAVTGALALERAAVVDDECPESICSDRGYAAGAAGDTYVRVGLVSLAIAVVTGATAGVLWLSAPDDAASVRVGVTSDSAGLAAVGHF